MKIWFIDVVSADGKRKFDCGKYGCLFIKQGLDALFETEDEENDTDDADPGLKLYDVFTCGYVF